MMASMQAFIKGHRAVDIPNSLRTSIPFHTNQSFRLHTNATPVVFGEWYWINPPTWFIWLLWTSSLTSPKKLGYGCHVGMTLDLKPLKLEFVIWCQRPKWNQQLRFWCFNSLIVRPSTERPFNRNGGNLQSLQIAGIKPSQPNACGVVGGQTAPPPTKPMPSWWRKGKGNWFVAHNQKESW